MADAALLYECRVSPDENLLNGDALARIKYRRQGERRWQSVVVVLDDDTTYETVVENAEQIAALHAGTL